MRTSRSSFPGKRHLLVAGVLGAFVAVIPTIANSETTTVEAVDEGGGGIYRETPETHRWANSTQTVIAGDTVAFRNSTEVPHGVEWRGSLKPTCSSGVPVGNTPAASGTKWNGTCTFSQPGTYPFWCTVHGAEMSGTITVSSNGTTTVTAPTTPPTTNTPTSPEPRPGREESLLAGPPSRALKLAGSQRGGLVHGSIALSRAAAGGRLEVDLLIRGAVLASAKRHTAVRVGRLVRNSLSPGKLTFAVRLDARARSALARRRRLTLTVKIVLTPVHGEATVLTKSVTERSR